VPAPWVKWGTIGAIVAGLTLVGAGTWTFLTRKSGETAAVADVANGSTVVSQAAANGDLQGTASSTAANAAAGNAAASTPGPTATGAAAPAAVTNEPIDQLLVRHGNDTTTEAALGRLFGLWGATYDPTRGKGCDQATQQGLECLFQKGSWAQLRTLNRPAVLTLTDDLGRTHQVLLSGLSDDTATLDLGGTPQLVSISAVSRYWFGDFLLLWRPPLAQAKALGPGSRGADVRWLRESLRSVQGLPPGPSRNDFYDAELTQLVQDFQRQHRLAIDGVAGVQTQIVLDTVLNATGSPTIVSAVTGG
jgi:general secretion pathway protein A